MIKKILKVEILILFIATSLSLFAFYFGEGLYDNVYSVSSDFDSPNLLLYGLSSLISFFGYYAGPWVFIPLVLSSVMYPFVFSKREFKLDILNPILLSCFILFAMFLIYPSIVGTGLQKIIKYNLSMPIIVSALAIFGVLTFTCFFRGTFKSLCLYSLDKLKSVASMAKEKTNSQMSSLPSPMSKLRELKNNSKIKISNLFTGIIRRKSNDETIYSSVDDADFYDEDYDEEYDDEDTQEEFTLGSNQDDEIDKILNQEKLQLETEQSLNFEGTSDKKANVEERAPARKKVSRKSALSKYSAKKKRERNKSYFSVVSNNFSGSSKSQSNKSPEGKYFSEIIERIEDKLGEFKIEGKIINILKGPVVDTFELDLGSGVKVSKVTGASEDLSLALHGAPIRIVYPMKGRTTIGIEVPRNPREFIFLDEIMNSTKFNENKMKLPLAMGKNAFGEIFIKDLADMPHMLVAGATGAGKSVFINCVLVSLLVKRSPDQMKLILIDPKQLELALYSNIPHLVMPVITEAKRASISLMWACQEMERRYSILKELGVRNIEGYNKKLASADPATLARIHQYFDDTEDFKLPYLVIVIDEFADLILTKAGKEIENNICRLAAKARASGIHLIIATQRPSVDVITGLIKSNFPTRVSFRVTTNTDSRTILNSTGAELLLGKGDMLYKQSVETIRVHSSFVGDEEIEEFTDSLANIEQEYNEKAMDFLENGGEVETDPYAFGSHINSPAGSGAGGGKDELYDEAVKVVMEHRSASASMLQRRLRVGYNRAANLVEELEKNGIVGPQQGSKPRKVIG